MGFVQSVETCLKKYVVFEGRASRSEFWWFWLATFAVSFLIQLLHIDWLSSIISLALLLPSLGVAVRRMHDVGKSGWFVLIPIYNIILAATPSQPTENQWGPVPTE